MRAFRLWAGGKKAKGYYSRPNSLGEPGWKNGTVAAAGSGFGLCPAADHEQHAADHAPTGHQECVEHGDEPRGLLGRGVQRGDEVVHAVVAEADAARRDRDGGDGVGDLRGEKVAAGRHRMLAERTADRQ